jgi:16S rRNA (adenine1518-N6/adenine1519-N6)-dimethyltransferase
MEKTIYKKSLGQHFIKDLNIHRKIVNMAGDISNFNIIEIGPGDGSLSKMIIEKNPKSFTMIEKDDDLKGKLEQIIENQKNCRLIFGDGTNIDLRNIVEKPSKIIANLPYNVANNMIMNWLEYGDFFESMTVLIQKEVANKFLLKGNRLNIMSELNYDVKKNFDLSPNVFVPKPKVDSTLITFSLLKKKRFDVNWLELNKLTKAAFSQPRKTILNNLKFFDKNIQEILIICKIDSQKRAENLTLEDFCNILLQIKSKTT